MFHLSLNFLQRLPSGGVGSYVAHRVYRRPHNSCFVWTGLLLLLRIMKYCVYIVFLTLLLATAVTANKHYKSCFRHNKCQTTDKNSQRCCRIGAKVGRHGYDCTVDTVIATHRHKLSFRQKTQSMSPQQPDKSFFNKVRKCKSFDTCFECCCKHRRKRQLNPQRLGKK